jgi:cytochrome c-type biogenesis protein CcmH/NrfF
MIAVPAQSAARPGQDDAAQQVAQDVADNLMSPYCPGRSISSCPSDAARDLEADILLQAQEGHSREEIEAQLVERFGEDKVGSAYSTDVVVVTLLVAIGAVFLVVRMGRKWAARSAARAAAGAAGGSREASLSDVSQGELDKLEDALDDLDEF